MLFIPLTGYANNVSYLQSRLNFQNLTLLRLHAASTVRIPHSTNNFQNLLPTVRVTPLNLFSTTTVNLHGASNSNIIRNNLQIRLSPLKSPILRKYINPFKRPGMYPSISKCNAKKCNCCNHLCSKTTITSSVNGRTFQWLMILI